jgi:hypothetical protein
MSITNEQFEDREVVVEVKIKVRVNKQDFKQEFFFHPDRLVQNFQLRVEQQPDSPGSVQLVDWDCDWEVLAVSQPVVDSDVDSCVSDCEA